MRSAKVKQLNKINERIQGLNIEIRNAEFNNESENKIAKLQEREEKACVAGFKCASTMTEEEYDASDFGIDMCMDYETAIS